MDPALIVTLAVGLLGGGALATIVVALLNRRKTTAEATNIEASTEGTRVDRTLAVLEAVLAEVKNELAGQRALREADRKEFATEVSTWREKSAQCDERLAAEIRAREHEKILARERDVAINDLKSELTVATSEVARLSRRAEEEDRRARDVMAASAASDLLKQAGVPNGGLRASMDALHDEVAEVKREVTTGNDATLAQLADQTESRRIEAIPDADRTDAEQDHIKDVPET